MKISRAVSQKRPLAGKFARDAKPDRDDEENRGERKRTVRCEREEPADDERSGSENLAAPFRLFVFRLFNSWRGARLPTAGI